MNQRLYCTLKQVLNDLQKNGTGNESHLLGFIADASQWIEQKFGEFIPFTADKFFTGDSTDSLRIPPLIELDSIDNDGTALDSDDVLLFGDGFGTPYYPDGPYIKITADPDALFVWSSEKGSVEVSGKWGKYSKLKAVGESITLDGSGTSFTASNASLFSPGMVLLIESEQIIITGTSLTTTPDVTILNGALDKSTDQVVVDDGSLFNVGEIIQVGVEDMFIRRKNGNTLLVQRAYNETSVSEHDDDSSVGVYRIFDITRGINGTEAAAHAAKAANQYTAPDDINFLCREIASLMSKKADSGYSGKTGNETLGEAFYFRTFPADDINKIGRNYRIISA